MGKESKRGQDLPWEHWHHRLEPFYRSGLRIIGEIPLTFKDLEELAGVCNQIFTKNGFVRGTHILYHDYPLLMLTLMPCFAAHNTQRDYWQAFADFIKVEKQALYNQKWHHIFVELAKARKFKVFTFEDDPTPYVTSIRFQGGIPAYSLPDYFEKMVLPAVERPGLREIKPQEALEYLIDHVYFVDSPVLDFLRNSGELGAEFFQESCKLARHALLNHGEILSVDDVELPEYVYYAFAEYWEHKEDIQQHWRKPFLQAAPYSEDTAVFLNLPQQEITLELTANRLFWQITYSDSGRRLERSCRVSRSRQSVVIQADYLPIPEKMGRIEVSLKAVLSNTGTVDELRRWSLSLLPSAGKTPLVAYNDEGIQLSSTRQLPAEVLFLLMPLDTQLIFDGEGRLVEECVPLVGNWQDWKMERWDLSQAWSLMLTRNDQPIGDVIPIQGVIAQPDLVGGHLFQFQDLDEPLYTSDLPSIRVPLTSLNATHTHLANWQLHVRSLWEANPHIDKTIRLSEVAGLVEVMNDRGIFPLKHVLGNNPAGIYDIRVSGPRGLSASFRIRLWPKLILSGHSMELTKSDEEQKPSVFFLRLQEKASCQVQPGSETVEIENTADGWRISAPPILNRVLLDLTTMAEGGGKVRVPVSIPLPKLRWGLATEKEGSTLEWGQALIRRSIDQILQAGSSSLHLEMYGLGDLNPNLKIRLIEISDSEPLLQEAKLIHTDFTRDWLRITLGQFNGTIQQINSFARFDLVYTPKEKYPEEICIPLMELSRALDIREVALQAMRNNVWKLSWQEDRPLKNRRMMMLPAWQPWQKPWEIKIPNEARGELILKDITPPLTRYHLYFYILPDYEKQLLEPPVGLTPFISDLCTPQERIAALPWDIESHDDRFRNLIEQAVIYDDLKDVQQRDLLLSKAALSLIHLTKLEVLIGALKWMQHKDIDQPIKSYFFNSMFNIKIIKSMLQAYKLHDPSLIEYLKYLEQVRNIPSDSAKLLVSLVDEPSTIARCLQILVSKEDTELPAIMEQMMSEARLSRRDALNLLSNDPVWAIENIAMLDPGPFSDSLIAGLLPIVAHQSVNTEPSRIMDWMIRALSYEEDSQLVQTYFEYYFEYKHPRRFELLMNAVTAGKVSNEVVLELLALDLSKSIEFLESKADDEISQTWIARLKQVFPSISGIIIPGRFINTPFGVANVDTITQYPNKNRVNQILLGDPDYYLNVTIGKDTDRFQMVIDYHDMIISIEGKEYVWKCGRCNFMHPDQGHTTHHYDITHGRLFLSLSRIRLPFSFSSDDIEILDRVNQ